LETKSVTTILYKAAVYFKGTTGPIGRHTHRTGPLDTTSNQPGCKSKPAAFKKWRLLQKAYLYRYFCHALPDTPQIHACPPLDVQKTTAPPFRLRDVTCVVIQLQTNSEAFRIHTQENLRMRHGPFNPSLPASVHCTDHYFLTCCRPRCTVWSWMHSRVPQF
jgi:hypothetical protein